MAFGKRRTQVPGADTPVELVDPETPAPSVEVEKPEVAASAEQPRGSRTMKYADAMAALEVGRLTRAVLTERGWVVPPVMPNDRRFARE